MKYVLGVNAGPHDTSAALLRDGELTAMIEQERLSGNRRAMGESPGNAIAACLAAEGIELGAVAEIAIGWDIPMLAEVEGVSYDEDEFTTWLLDGVGPYARPLPPLRFVSHHVAHAASAFYTSGMKEAAILILDGRGESVATTMASGGPGGIEVLETWGINDSLGHLYGCASAWAGLTLWGAGKLMGLASYGRPCQPVPLRPSENGYAIDGAPNSDSPVASHLPQLRLGLMEGFRKNNFPFSAGNPDEPMAHANFAASIQGALEQILLHLATRARRETGHSNLVMAGGVALNCAANGALIRSGVFDEVWIPPFPHDAGVSLGAALVADRIGRNSPPTAVRLPHAFWAPGDGEPSADELTELLPGLEVDRLGDSQLAEATARHIEEGRLVGWWQGRAEVGQRALGARSILCDPRRRQMLVRANLVKGRESWRPLAPAILAEHADSVFGGPLPAAADFMLAAWPMRASARSQLPAAVHVDGSARPQVVRPEQARYHDVIESFYERTGVPTVINTSFNLAGTPIVHSARDAVDTFLQSDLDVLVLGDLVAVKPPIEESTPPRRSSPPTEENFYLPWWRPSS